MHIIFCSDLNRTTLPGGWCEQSHSMRGNQLFNSPEMHLPKTLCRSFKLIGSLNGEATEILSVSENRKRAYHIPLNQKFDTLTLIPLEIWSDAEKIPVISFDFN